MILLVIVLFALIYLTIFTFAQSSSDSTSLHAQKEHSCNATTGNNKSNYILLVCGKDTVSGLTDVILLANLDIAKNSVNIVQIPRDTFVCYNNTTQKINSIANSKNGIDSLANLLESACGINVDYTLEFTLDAFSHFIDLIGGVTVNIPNDMNYEDPSQSLTIHFKSGDNLLYGDTAAKFVRFRSGYVQGDIARIDAQKIFIAALAKKITQELSPLKIPAIIGAIIGEIKTNMSLQESLQLSKAAMNIDISNVKMITLPGKDARAQVDRGVWYYIVNRPAAYNVISKYIISENNPTSIGNFDPHKYFSSAKYSHFEEIYNDTQLNFKEYSAEEIINNGIDIDLIQ